MISRDDEHVFVLGGGPLGRELASRLSERNTVNLVQDRTIGQRADEDGFVAHRAEPTDVKALREIDVARADLAVVATMVDRQSVLATQLLRSQFGIEDIVLLVNDPDVREAVEPMEVETVCLPDSLVPELEALVERRIRERE